MDLALAAGPLASSDPTGDQPALRFLDSLLEQAQQHDVTVSLYPHHAVWLESTHHAVRLCRALQHPNLGITLSGYHWYLQPDPSMDRDIPPMAPHLRSGNICGATRTPGHSQPATIHPVDDGELDNFLLLGRLSQNGYAGPIGIQGFDVAGDVYNKLRRSLTATREILHRIQEHSSWALTRPT